MQNKINKAYDRNNKKEFYKYAMDTFCFVIQIIS